MTIKLPTKPSCKKHPKYAAKRQPRGNCLDCWVDYVLINLNYWLAEKARA